MKKKICFFVSDLNIGGIERAITSLVNKIDKNRYDVTLFLEKKEGIYLKDINKDVHLVNFNLSDNSNILMRKIFNFTKLVLFTIKYYHRFSFSANFKSTSKAGAILSKRFSKNSAFWFHGNYYRTKEEGNEFLKQFKVKKYPKVVFVSKKLKEKYLEIYSNTKQKLYCLNNPMEFEEIIKKSNEKIEIEKDKKTLLNVGRHSEEEKHLTMLLKVSKRLINEKYDFNLWMLGDGKDSKLYQELVKELEIDNYIKFLGSTSNVYPYIKKCDCVVLSSYMEGNPVVFLETKLLHKPIVTTDVSDAREELDGFGIVTENNEESFYQGLKEFLEKGYEIKRKFNPLEYNQNIFKTLDKIIGEKND